MAKLVRFQITIKIKEINKIRNSFITTFVRVSYYLNQYKRRSGPTETSECTGADCGAASGSARVVCCIFYQ